jgi:hypothetical protein
VSVIVPKHRPQMSSCSGFGDNAKISRYYLEFNLLYLVI